MMHKAIEFATMAHKNNVRKGTDIPYIVHPFEVAQILTSCGCAEITIIAGLLHDTVEDTSVTIEQIEKEFSREIAKLVDFCSEDKSKTWEERKHHTINFLKNTIDIEILLLTCADKLSNLRSIKSDYENIGDKLWDRFNKGKAGFKCFFIT